MSPLDEYRRFYKIFCVACALSSNDITEDSDYILKVELVGGERTSSQFESLDDVKRFLEQYEEALPDQIKDWVVYIGDKRIADKSGGWERIHPDVYEHEMARERLSKLSHPEFSTKTAKIRSQRSSKSARQRFNELFR